MDLKLRSEAPVFKRCCFCLPLRQGLIGWAYARLLLSIPIVCYSIDVITFRFDAPMIFLSIYVALAVLSMADVAFTGLLVLACHKRNFRLLKISYIHGIVWLTIFMGLGSYVLIIKIIHLYTTWDCCTPFRFQISELMLMIAFISTSVFIQLYVILLTRSAAIKLQNQSLEMQFVNNATEAEARCVSAERSTEQYTDGKNSAQSTENGHDSSVQHGV